jgi:WD40 repeat protein
VRGAEFSPDGTRVVTAGQDRVARIWNAIEGTPIAQLEGHTASLATAAFSPDGRSIVTGSDDGTARVWDAETQTVIATLSAFKGKVSWAQFSSDGTRIATAHLDQTANIWDAASGRLLITLPGFGSEVRSAAFSPDQERLVTANGDGAIRIWDVARQTQTWEELARDACNQLLSAGSRTFSDIEIRSDRLLQAEWSDAAKDVCAGVEGVAPIRDAYAAARITR